METRSNSDKILIGRGYGEEILYAVKAAKKSVKIVSPYLSGTYLDELIALKNKCVDVTLITSDNLTEAGSKYSFDDRKIVKQKRIPILCSGKNKKKNLRVVSFSFFLFSLLFVSLSAFYFPLLFVSAFLLLISIILFAYSYSYSYPMKTYLYKYSSIFRIRIFDSKSGDKPWSTNLIHSKIFLIDDSVCYLGSANFTWSGFKTHYETIIKVEDLQAIKDINEEVEALFNSKELTSKDINQWGREVYE